MINFYEDQTYILMCEKAENYLPDVERLTIGYLEPGIIFQNDNVFDFDGEKFIWLPRQNQLQKMVDSLNVANRFCLYLKEDQTPLFKSFEMAWLHFVMKEKHNCVWGQNIWLGS